MGNICLFRGRSDEGIPYLEKATRLAPNLPQAHRDLGKAYFEKEELEKAVAEYKRVAELDPQEDTVHYRLAAIYRKLGRKEQAQTETTLFQTLNRKAQASRNPMLPTPLPEEQQ